MTKEAIQKEIDCLRDVKNHLWNAIIVSIGGSVALTFNLNDLWKYTLFVSGILLSFIFLNGYFQKDDKINELLEKLKKET